MNRCALTLALFLAALNLPAHAQLRAITAADILKAGIEVPPPAPAAAALAPRNPKNKLPALLPDDPLIVVHASRAFDETASAAGGINAVVAGYRAAGRPVIYLLNDQSAQGYSDWYPADRSPDYELFSAGGEHNLPLAADQVTIIGGFFGSYDGARGCQTLAARDAIRMHFEASGKPFTVNMPLKAIYFYEEDAGIYKELLALDPKTAPPAAVRKVFDRFPELFFLVDNFPTSAPDALGFGHPFTFQDENPGYRMGEPVDTARYAFELFFDGISVAKFGSGPRRVSLKLFN
ncbi:MAG: hypothetical protein WCK76_00230 [Elusimicrobiota bacterium]